MNPEDSSFILPSLFQREGLGVSLRTDSIEHNCYRNCISSILVPTELESSAGENQSKTFAEIAFPSGSCRIGTSGIIVNCHPACQVEASEDWKNSSCFSYEGSHLHLDSSVFANSSYEVVMLRRIEATTVHVV